jgi:valyl-tRNA synthetase
MTLISREAYELVDLAVSQGVVLQVGHIFRFNSALRKAREILDQLIQDMKLPDREVRQKLSAETMDVAAEKARLKKEIEGLQKAIASKERQLGNETFRSRAPENIIKGLEATLAEQRVELQKLQDRLSQIEKGS